ncbi:protein FAR1-RELATED SEQUENCE 5-like [Rhizophagus irregularis DAOM 181602=DAOM 197198]|nr:protein FAR1-RELATED SEQUENCE 5-like [Rhizophagus irregularis DAOM 181602=DAOM 197198]
MCPWHINLTMPKSSTEVSITSITGEHNHSMITDIHLHAPYRKLSNEILERIEFYVNKGNMGSKQIYPLLVASFPDQYIYKRDLYNAIQKFKSPLTNRHGDAQNMINKLFELKDQEPGWIIYTRLDPFDNRLVGLFWMSPNQHQCLLRYNDIVQTDNTCRTNWFDMYLTLLVIVDNNTKSRLVAQCLSEDETIESYEWFLDCLLQTTNNNPPTCLFSDADPALLNAVTSKFPESHHFLCIFHIQENLQKNLAECLNRTLNNCHQAWARCYQTKCFTAGIQSTQRVEVINHLIKEGTGSTTSLCNLHIQIQKLLDNEAQWARHNAYLQSLPTNQAPSIIEPIFPKVVELMKKYLTPHILSVQQQQILGSLLYHAKIISKESIDTIKDDDQCNYNEGFLEDHLDRPQTSLFSLFEEIELSDIIEIWELYGLTKSYKHYIILLIDGGHLCTCLAIINCGLVCSHYFQVMMNSKVAKFNIGLIARRWYIEDIQDQYIQANLQDETVGIVTQFQQDDNNTALVTDLHIFKQLRIPDVFTNNIKQCLQRKVKYAYGFGKMKKALNLALDLGCENEIIDMINKFINCKKNIIKDANNDENNEENLQILDPIVQK